jgi:hypothetical protein
VILTRSLFGLTLAQASFAQGFMGKTLIGKGASIGSRRRPFGLVSPASAKKKNI